MAVRVVLAVLFAVALLGASTPAIERARIDTANAQVEREVERLLATADSLRASSDPVPAGAPGARRSVTLRLPGETWGRVALETMVVTNGTITWRVTGGTRQVRRIRWLREDGPPGTLVLSGPGTVHLELRLVRLADSETVVVRHTFISDGAPRPGHVRALRAGGRGNGHVSV